MAAASFLLCGGGSVLSVYATKENLGLDVMLATCCPCWRPRSPGLQSSFLVLAALMRDVGPRAAIPDGRYRRGLRPLLGFCLFVSSGLNSALGGNSARRKEALPLMLVLCPSCWPSAGAVSASRFHPTLINGPLTRLRWSSSSHPSGTRRCITGRPPVRGSSPPRVSTGDTKPTRGRCCPRTGPTSISSSSTATARSGC